MVNSLNVIWSSQSALPWCGAGTAGRVGFGVGLRGASIHDRATAALAIGVLLPLQTQRSAGSNRSRIRSAQWTPPLRKRAIDFVVPSDEVATDTKTFEHRTSEVGV